MTELRGGGKDKVDKNFRSANLAQRNMNLKSSKLIFLASIISSIFLCFQVYYAHNQSVRAATANENLTVTVTVPGDTGGSGGGSDLPPSIFNVITSTSFASASISWSATDDRGISLVTFVYGDSVNYGSSGVVTGNYQVALSSLVTGTVYYYKISVVDTRSNLVEYTGTLVMLSSPAPPIDTTPPVISNIQIIPGVTTTTIRWTTDELADSQVSYGPTAAYGSNYFDSSRSLVHSVLLFNLTPGTLYHFQIISTDSSNNSAGTIDATFTTLTDTIPPPDASNFILTTTSNSIVLSWVNPTLVGTPDFAEVRVVRKIDSASTNPADGVVVYAGTQENFTDSSVLVNINYFYTIFSFDTSNNSSPGIFRSGRITPIVPPVEICGNSIDDNSNGYTDCADSACSSLPSCTVTPPPTTTPSPEICNNSIDDNSNGFVDCADTACSGFAGCSGTSALAACNNTLDDDVDGAFDFPNDIGCESAVDNDEYNPPEPTVPPFLKLNLNDLRFFSGNRLIRLYPVGDVVVGLSGANLTLVLPRSVLESEPRNIILRVGGTDIHQFVYNTTDQAYYADLSFGSVGISQAYLEIDYGSSQSDSVGFKMDSLSWGQVQGSDNQAVVAAEIILYGSNNEQFPMGLYGQLNPMTADINGNYGWIVPNGNYKIFVHKEGFYDRSINFTVSNNVINSNISLISQPPKLILTIDPNASLSENIQNVAGALAGQTKILSTVAVQKIQDAVSDPEVKKVNERVVAPAAITVVVAGAAPLISWLDLLPFLRLLFLQPLMLLGWRKREKWGLVYNSLNKLPVDLAMIRLINAETNRVVQSKVTDSKGHFIFMVGPGKYKLEVRKNNFVFPSKFLADSISDGQKADIYHGEIIEVLSPSGITATVPLDPVEAHKKPSRLIWEKFGRRLQTVLSVVGILITAFSLYISPKWYIIALLIVHILVFFIFQKLARPPKIRNWGIVYDDMQKTPISRVVARLFNSQFNKLVDTQVTDGSGKYYFMAGDAKYYVTYEHKEYHPQKTDIINLEGKEPEAITVEVRLKKN